eukprot:Hpha_TRINITY_DN16254_c6_g1::TRINITY_DN16254_c6_g1_i1::g.13875::m.13875
MGGCCRWDWLVRPGDTADEARIKTRMFPFALFVCPVYTFILVRQLQSINQMVNVIGYAINAFSMLLFMMAVMGNVMPAGYLLDVLLVFMTVGVCASDLGNATASYSFRAWAFVVLILDCALVFKRYHMSRFIIPFVL